MLHSIYNLLIVLMIILSVIIVLAIMIQPSRTDGTAGLFTGGGSDDLFERHKARGFEAVMQTFTAVVIGIWLFIGFLLVVLSSK